MMRQMGRSSVEEPLRTQTNTRRGSAGTSSVKRRLTKPTRIHYVTTTGLTLVVLWTFSLSHCCASAFHRRRNTAISTTARSAFHGRRVTMRGGDANDSSSGEIEDSSSLMSSDYVQEESTILSEDSVEPLTTAAEVPASSKARETTHETETRTNRVDDSSSGSDTDASSTLTREETVDVPSLDTFVNYDEDADTLSSMAPVLETTTINVLDTSSLPKQGFEREKSHQSLNQEQRDSIVDTGIESSSEDGEVMPNSETRLPENEQESYSFVVDDTLSLEEAQEQSAEMRLQGRTLHDESDFVNAAVAFSRAARLLESFIDESTDCAEDWSTCRLHEALCCLKADDNQKAVVACNKVLDRAFTSGAVRARALYRRAKAYTGLGESDLALTDARGAAFLGDRRGVALYGQLMRESPSSARAFLPPHSAPTSSVIDDLASSGALFESLLKKSPAEHAMSKPDNAPLPFNPLSLLSGMGSGSSPALPNGGKDTAGLAKSVLSSLSKRLEDETTQDTICQYLQQTSGPQIQKYAGMAGMELPESQATRIANFLRGVTPKAIRRTVRNGKRLVYSVQLMRKVSKVITKYRSLLIWICLLGWAKSAFLRPIPVNQRLARLEAKKGMK